MTQVSMTPEQFEMIKGELTRADPKEITITPKDDVSGGLSGYDAAHNYNWTAEYAYVSGALEITGHGIFGIGGKVEKGIVSKLQVALAQ